MTKDMPLQGRMMHRPLLISDILEFAADAHPTAGIVSATVEGGLHRATYAETARRTKRLAKALLALGIGEGDRVATLAWNGYRHFELYYAVSGIGAVCHTINPRLSAEQMTYIIGHAGDRVLFFDTTFTPILERLKNQLPDDLIYVAMTDRAHMPDTTLSGVVCYEDLLAAQSDDYDWPEFPEDTASSLCYTSGTTGEPKGALYSHRSTVLHALMCGISFQTCMTPGCSILPVVPMFHVNAWGSPYCAPLTGASLVMPGAALDGPSLFALMDGEAVFSAWGVPTVWMGLLAEIEKRGRCPNGFGEVIIGGSAAPRTMIEAFETMDVSVCHAWGMTEMSPIGTQGLLTPPLDALPYVERIARKETQGRRIFGVDLKIVDEKGARLPHDGAATGELHVRGNTVISGYFDNETASREAFDTEGWFGTGDVASIDTEGFLAITDRAKDLIKSGGEWISSLDLENVMMSHGDVANCAVIAVADAKWGERPLLVIVPKEGARPDRDALIAHLAERFAKWQLPDDVIFVDALPLTATGKVSKLSLRAMYSEGKG